MQPTIYLGIVLALLAAIFVVRDRVNLAWWFFAISQVLGATSVANLTALGGASLSFPQVGVAILVVTAFAVALRDNQSLRRSLEIHAVALALILYTLIISFWGPRLFAGQLELVSMRAGEDGNRIAPLGPSSTNITHSLYLTGSFLTAVAVACLFARSLKAGQFRNAVLALGLVHVFLGVVDAMGAVAGQSGVLNFLRNANYSMMEQTMGGVKRLSGSLPEPAAYATFAVPLAVFATEDWLRTRGRLAGVAGVLLWLLTLASTSSTGIVSVVIYLATAIPRIVFLRGRFAMKTGVLLVTGGAVLGLTALFLAQPESYIATRDFVFDLTIDKGDSFSAIERGSWSAQGWTAFVASHGLGIGAGSFRCSNFFLAVVGSLGAIGALLMIIFVAQVVLAASVKSSDSLQKSAAWASLFALVPAMFSGPTPDPGFIFGMFAGFALHPHLASKKVEPAVMIPIMRSAGRATSR